MTHLLFYLCTVVSYISAGIPIEVYEKVTSWTGNNAALRINRASYRKFREKINATKELQGIILGLIDQNVTEFSWKTISEMTRKLQFFKPYILKRPQLLNVIGASIPKDQWISESIFAFEAFGMKAITISQYHNLTISDSFNLTESARKKLKILIGSSRAFNAADYWNESETITQQMRIWLLDVDANFPWLIRDVYPNLIYNTFLMHYIWTKFHREMKIPPLESVMHLNGDEDECQFLKLLTMRYGLVFRPYALQRLWKDKISFFARSNALSIFAVPSVIFIYELLDAERLSHIFLEDVDFASDFMTELILEWAMRLNLTASTKKASVLIGQETPEYCVDLMLELMWLQYNNSGRENQKCWKLLDVIKIIAFGFDAKQKMEQNNTSWSKEFRDDILAHSGISKRPEKPRFGWQDYLFGVYLLLFVVMFMAAGTLHDNEDYPLEYQYNLILYVWIIISAGFMLLLNY